MTKRRSLAERFWAKVDTSGDCWLWTAGVTTSGYGHIYIDGAGATARSDRAHRVSWRLANGEIPKGLSILHRCDTPACVRPDHLFLGTQSDNVADMRSKGRARTTPHRGENSPLAKLTEAAVREMRRLRSEGATYTAIGERFGIDRGYAHQIVNRRRWAHVADLTNTSTERERSIV